MLLVAAILELELPLVGRQTLRPLPQAAQLRRGDSELLAGLGQLRRGALQVLSALLQRRLLFGDRVSQTFRFALCNLQLSLELGIPLLASGELGLDLTQSGPLLLHDAQQRRVLTLQGGLGETLLVARAALGGEVALELPHAAGGLVELLLPSALAGLQPVLCGGEVVRQLPGLRRGLPELCAELFLAGLGRGGSHLELQSQLDGGLLGAEGLLFEAHAELVLPLLRPQLGLAHALGRLGGHLALALLRLRFNLT
mmetsp:Transcript_24863/g.71817  ORF Transcript_24863/g.71817 Transcript_24863/m.71817 type:complete len:255 (+) Transcript_24863:1374-2138(+)